MKHINPISAWTDYSYELTNHVLTRDSLIKATNSFYSNISTQLYGQIISLQVKVKVTNGAIRTITRLINFTLSDYSKVNSVILEYWELKRDYYEVLEFDKLIFTYKIHKLDSIIKEPRIVQPTSVVSTKLKSKFGGYSLPKTMDIFQWGDILFISSDSKRALIRKHNGNSIYQIYIKD
uniref:Uncharacterized protein n=1 Tax=Cantharellus lutescens TaxID=104198 RepID=A0A2S0S4C8_9AGAM|nr:hypothetical protein [Cantharellus lutescens]AWA82203.1 hypothetical protein [Cantharellus lutescens]